MMCVPIDNVKKDHIVMFSNGYGDILRKPFSVKNAPESVKYLTEQVRRSCRHRGINYKHVFFGGEDVGSYTENFVNTLRSKGWIVAGVNAHDAKKKRANIQASTDRLDLMENRFSACQIHRPKRSRLIDILKRYGTSNPELAAAKLQEYARQVLTTPQEYMSTLQLSLAQHVKHLRCLHENIAQVERGIALWLSRTQGAFLTTVGEIGIVLATPFNRNH